MPQRLWPKSVHQGGRAVKLKPVNAVLCHRPGAGPQRSKIAFHGSDLASGKRSQNRSLLGEVSHISSAWVSRYAFGAGVVAVTVLPGKEVPSPGISDKIDVVAYAAPGPSGGLAFPTRRGALLLLVLLPLMGIGTGDRPVGSAATIVGHRRRLADLAGVSLMLLPVVFVRFGRCATR